MIPSLNSAAKALASPAPKPTPVTQSKPATIARPATGSAPMLHEGGPVPTDGVYQLKAGEHVLTQPQAKMVRHHALMAVGMKPLARPKTAGEPTKQDKAVKTPEKKSTSGITVRPEKKQAAKISVKVAPKKK